MSEPPLLAVRDLDAFYGDFQALFGLSMEIAAGEAVAVIGANGAGKSTLLRSIAGLLRARPDAITFNGARIGGMPAHAVAAQGIALVPEGRGLFASLSVEENLLIGGQLKRPGPWNLQRIYELFPVLGERRQLPSTALSGGQQQMVAISRGLMSNPKLLLCDEISLGLAPIVVREIYARAGDSRPGHFAVAGRAGRRAGAQDDAARLLPPGRPRGARRRREGSDPGGNRGGLFRGVIFSPSPTRGGRSGA
jgi:branched-chain amino acid transport system ATP-binding protein